MHATNITTVTMNQTPDSFINDQDSELTYIETAAFSVLH